MPAELVHALDAERGVEQPAVARAIVGAHPVAAPPGGLAEDPDAQALRAIDTDTGAQVRLLPLSESKWNRVRARTLIGAGPMCVSHLHVNAVRGTGVEAVRSFSSS